FDNFPYTLSGPSPLHSSFAIAAQIVRSRGWNVIDDSTTALVKSKHDVLGYFSWGYTDPAAKKFGGIRTFNTYDKASIGTTFYSFTEFTSDSAKSGIATITNNMLVSEGLTSFSGFVFEPWAFGMTYIPILVDRYTDTSQDRRFNLAESYYS